MWSVEQPDIVIEVYGKRISDSSLRMEKLGGKEEGEPDRG